MITRHHLALAILCTVILCGALVPSDPVLILIICLGACTGAILPDIQMKKPHGIQLRTLAWLVTRFSSIVCTSMIRPAYHAVSGGIYHPTDKRLTHSVPGILCIGAACTALLILPAFLVMGSAALYLPVAFLGGVVLGMVLHLLEDLCTRKGITPLFPFSTMKIFGSIRPCDTSDRRLAGRLIGAGMPVRPGLLRGNDDMVFGCATLFRTRQRPGACNNRTDPV